MPEIILILVAIHSRAPLVIRIFARKEEFNYTARADATPATRKNVWYRTEGINSRARVDRSS